MESFEEKYKAEGLPHTVEAMLDLWHYLRETGPELLAGWQMLLEDYADIMTRKQRQEILLFLRDMLMPQDFSVFFSELLEEADTLIYEFRPEGAVVVDCHDPEEVVDIPTRVDGLPVIGIANNVFEARTEIRVVILPMTLRFIGDFAFAHCFHLRCVSVGLSDRDALATSLLPPSLRSIGRMAFSGTALRDVTIPGKSIRLGELCFGNCRELSTLWLPDAGEVEFGKSTFFNSGLRHLYMPNAHIPCLPESCFCFCRQLISVQAASIRGVGNHCFEHCAELQTLTAARPMDFVGEDAFRGCRFWVADGMFPTLRSVILGCGGEAFLEGVIRLMQDSTCFREAEDAFPDRAGLEKLIRTALERIRECPRSPESGKLLLHHTGTWYHDPECWDLQAKFTLWNSRDILDNFREIPAWDPLLPDPENAMPLDEVFYALEASELMKLCLYRSEPEPLAWDWACPGPVLDARLGGGSVRLQWLTAEVFLARYADYLRGCRDPEEACPDPKHGWVPGWEDNDLDMPAAKCHWLQWDVLFNRLTRYEQLKLAFRQLRSRSE